MGGLGVDSAVQRHAAAPWTAWHSIIPTLMEATDSPDIDSLFAPTPILRSQLHQLQTTLAQQMNTPSLLLKSLGAALRTHKSQKALVNTIQQTTHQQLLASLSTNPIQKAIFLSQTAKNRCPPATTQQRCLRSGRQMLPSLACTTTHASPPSREPRFQHLNYVPQRQCSQTHMCLHHRFPPTTLHDLQKWRRC